MFEEVFELEQERDFSQKISGTFTFIRLNFKSFLQSLLFIVSPLALLTGIFQGLGQINSTTKQPEIASDASMTEVLESLMAMQQAFSVWQLLAVVAMVLSSLALTLVVYCFIEVYRQRKQVAFDDVVQFAKYYTGPLLRMYLLLIVVMVGIALIVGLAIQAIAVSIGFEFGFLLAVPLLLLAFYFVIMFALCPAIVIFENGSASYALNRAKFLIKDKWWSTFGLLMVISFISYFMSAIFQIPMGIISLLKILGINSVFTSAGTLIASTIISNVGTTLIASISHVALSMQYFNLIELKEGKSTWNSIDSIGKNN